MLDMDDIQCRETREKSLHQAGIGTCSLAWQVGFFFDGIHRNINQDSDTHRLSNVSRLFRAYPDRDTMDLDSSYLYSAIYIPGLGTPYEDQVADRLHSVMDSQLNALSDNSLDSTSSTAKEAAVDALYEANKKDWFDTLSHNLNDLFSIKTAKAVITDTAKSIGKQVTLEALPSLRDNPVVMEQFMTGVDARIDGAKKAFKKQFSSVKAKNQLPIKLIQISVFGADLGGILARRFIDELLEDVCSKEGDAYSYEGVKIEITFAGLFDCSRRSSFDSGDTMADAFSLAGLLARPIAGPLEWIGGPKVIDFSKQLHPAVKKALHLVAAHERRVYRPVVPLGTLKSEWRELLLPGVSEDITGGLLPNEQRPSAELCRVALHEMYRVARKGEVPFPNFNDLQEISEKVASYFVMNDNLAGKSVRYYSRRYMQMAGNTTLSSKAFAHHLAIYVEWLGRQYADYKARLAKANAEERKWLKDRWGWLEFVRDEARYVERAATNPNGYVAYAQRSNALKMAKTFLYPPLRAFPEEVAIFFTYFMHDFVGATAFTRSPSEQLKIREQSETMISSHHFFLSRGIETLPFNKNINDSKVAVNEHVAAYFVCKKHMPVIAELTQKNKFAITFREAGDATIKALEKGAAAKGHDILEKTIKLSSIKNGYPNRFGEVLRKVKQEEIVGAVGHWDQHGELIGMYLCITDIQKNSALFRSLSNIQNKYNSAIYPLNVDDLHNSLTLLKSEANWQRLIFTGDYDIHDLITYSGSGKPRSVLAEKEGLPRQEDRMIRDKINASIARVDPFRPTGKVEYNVVRHGAQANYPAHMLINENKHEFVKAVAQPGPFPLAGCYKGDWELISSIEELDIFYKKTGALLKSTWDSKSNRAFKDETSGTVSLKRNK